MKRLLALSLMLALSACGGRQVLKPKSGQALPPKPAATVIAPTAEQLMVPDNQARPQRSDELLLKSEKRRDDPFDLPPKG
jgi:hypothetical protein